MGTSAFLGWRSFSTPCWRAHSVPRADGPRPSIWRWPDPIWSSSLGTVTGSHRADGGYGPVVRPSPPTWSMKPDRGPKWRPWPPLMPLRNAQRRGPEWRPPEWPPWRPFGRTTTTRSCTRRHERRARGWLTTGQPCRSSSRSCVSPAASWMSGWPGTRDGQTSSNSSSPASRRPRRKRPMRRRRPAKNGDGSTRA